MSKELILSMTVSLDGFVAGPNGEFEWAYPAMSDEGRQWVAERFSEASLIAMGRVSYQAMADFWGTAVNPIAPHMNEIPKVAFSRTGSIVPPEMENTAAAIAKAENSEDADRMRRALESWQNPMMAGTNLVADIQQLKAEDGKPILAIAGASFAASLMKTDLIDVFRLSVHPVALGRGIPLFGELPAPLRLKLEDVKQFPTGAMVKTYRR